MAHSPRQVEAIELSESWTERRTEAKNEPRLTADVNPSHLIRIVQSGHNFGASIESGSLVRPFRSLKHYIEKLLSPSVLLTAVGTSLALGWMRYYYDPEFENKMGAYATMLGLALCVVLLSKGTSPWLVFSSFIALLGAVGVISKREILDGFSKDGAWIPQFLLVIMTAIRESGVVEDVLSYVLSDYGPGKRSRLGVLLRFQCACAFLAMLVGAGPAITTAVPIVTRWAKAAGCPVGPPLQLLVTSASCGGVMLFTSAPISVVIRDILTTASGGCRTPVSGMLQVALIIFVALSAYTLWALPGIRTTSCDAPSSPTSGGRTLPEVTNGGDSTGSVPAESVQELTSRLHYKLEFVVKPGSSVIGLSPKTVGISRSSGVNLLMVCRSGSPQQSHCRSATSSAAPRTEWLAETMDQSEIKQWKFEAGDVMVAQCSVQGIIFMRKNPGVFALRGLHCNDLLGGRRYMRRLFECVLAEGSSLVGQTLEEILGLDQLDTKDMSPGSVDEDMEEAAPARLRQTLRGMEAPDFLKQHLGYPLAGFRRNTGLKAVPRVTPLSITSDPLAPGDVLLVDAFEDFPDLHDTLENFLVVSLVPGSQAPRHGRRLDRFRGVAAICLLIGIDICADAFEYPLVVGTLIGAILCVITRTVHVSQVLQSLNWPLLLTFGAGAAVSNAVTTTGVAKFLSGGIYLVRDVYGTCGMLVALSLTSQFSANILSNVATGLIIAPLAAEGVSTERGMTAPVCVLLAISCNMALCTPFAGPNTNISSIAGLTQKQYLRFGVPAQVIVTICVVSWAFLSLDTLQSSPAPESNSTRLEAFQ